MATGTETARPGLMRFLAKKGGALPMGELHTHSKVFYQAAHQAFSQLMEGLVGTDWWPTTSAAPPSRSPRGVRRRCVPRRVRSDVP